jgi:vacuolar-type H+-ATPase subunit C/Vma6
MGTLSELALSVFPASDFRGLTDFQRLCAGTLAEEVAGLCKRLSGPGAALLRWLLVRFQVENLKVLIRVHLARTPRTDAHQYLIPFPGRSSLNVHELSAAESLTDFIRLVPDPFFRKGLEKAFEIHGDNPRPFFFETALDHCFLHGLLARVEDLPGEDRETVLPMARQEADIFHLALVGRGRFLYGLAPETLLPLHVMGGRIPFDHLSSMLNERDLSLAVQHAHSVISDSNDGTGRTAAESGKIEEDPRFYERLAWRQFLRLSNLAFRSSHMGLAAVVGYVGIRRVEVANLITLSEGIRNRMAAEAICARMIVYSEEETTHV